MAENSSYLPIAVAFAAGVAVGAVVTSRDEPRRVPAPAVEETAAAAEEAAEAAVDEGASMMEAAEEMAEAAAEAAGDAVDAVAAEAAEMAESMGVLEAAEDVSDDVRERVNVLAQQMAGIVAMIQDLQAGGAAPAAPAAAPESAAPAAAPEAAPVSSGADALRAEIGDTGLVLAVGEIGEVQEVRVFMSRIDAAADAARVMIVGVGPQMLSVGGQPLDLGNGCSASLAGIADGAAFIKIVCAS